MKPRILLVDDEPRNLLLLEALLSKCPYETVRATGGQQALDLIAADKIDLVLLDLMMPGMDGIAVLQALRAHASTAQLPVVVVTALSDRAERLRGLRAGADDFIEKPIDADVLLARVQTLLRLKSANDQLAEHNIALEQLQREQRELTEMIVHDLRNPICVASMCLEFALSKRSADLNAHVEDFHDALGAVRKMEGLAEQLLLVSRLERADFPLCPEAVAVESLLGEVHRAHQREASLRTVCLSLATHPELSVRADKMLLRRVVENLVSNALRHTPPQGQVQLTSRLVDDAEILVSNSGSRIPVENRQHIFKKFWRDPQSPQNTVNLGLGLYFCRRAVEAHGGNISVVDADGFETSFLVQLPR